VCELKIGVDFYGNTVILTNGTFLNGLIHVGSSQMRGGRIGEAASYNITEQLFDAGFKTGRLKTGTPVRIDGRTIDFSKLTEQKGDDTHFKFSYLPGTKSKLQQRSCWITHTNPEFTVNWNWDLIFHLCSTELFKVPVRVIAPVLSLNC
jgi:tRNA uridine 5-carboxymethylaminomethyl modification enzyme